MASFSNTELNAVVQELWDQEVDDARYATAVLMPRVMNKSGIARKKGDIIHMTVEGRFTVGDVGANGAFVPQVYTPETVAITINQHKQIAISIEDKTDSQAFWTPESTFPKQAGKGMAEDYDSALSALHTDLVSNVVGDEGNPSAFSTERMRAAMLKLDDRNVPMQDRSFVLPPIAFYNGVLAETQLTDADKAGLPKSALTTGFRSALLGTPAYYSTLLKTVGTSLKGFLLHKSTFAIAFQRNNEIKRADRTSALFLADVIVAQSLYGVKTFRENHGVVINVANS